jgi:hypothetical protein
MTQHTPNTRVRHKPGKNGIKWFDGHVVDEIGPLKTLHQLGRYPSNEFGSTSDKKNCGSGLPAHKQLFVSHQTMSANPYQIPGPIQSLPTPHLEARIEIKPGQGRTPEAEKTEEREWIYLE